VSQTGRGEVVIGGGADVFNSYAQRGGLPVFEANAQAAVELFPCLSRLRVMRQWAGTADITPDTSPVMGLTPIEGLFISAGWGTGGYKAIPAGGETMAWTIANGEPHELIRSFGLDRFAAGALVDEGRRLRRRALMGYRLDKGGHIDRSQPIHFRWNGRKVAAFAGDTVASALLANDIPVVGRGMKLHRPRGCSPSARRSRTRS
jgi:hypothetical protein